MDFVRYLLATILFAAVTISAMFMVDIELFGKFTFMIVLPRLCRGRPSQQQRIACAKLTLANIEIQSDDVTKMIFLKLWVLFNCSEQSI